MTVRWPTLRPWLLRLGVLAAALGLWQGLSAAGVIRADEFPSMTQTASALWDQASTATLWTAIGQTLEGWAIGLAIGTAAALAIGTLIALNQFAYRSVIGVIEFFKAIPVIAILPIGLVLWGATLTMKFALVAFAVFWPLVIQVCYGVRSIDPVVRDTATVLRLRGPRRFVTVISAERGAVRRDRPARRGRRRAGRGHHHRADRRRHRHRRAHPAGGERGPGRLPGHVRVHRGRRPARRAAGGRVHGRGTVRAALARVAAGCR